MNCKLHERLSAAFISGICVGLLMALSAIIFARVAKADDRYPKADDRYPFGQTMQIEIVGPRDFAQNVASVLSSPAFPLSRPIAVTWRKRPHSMNRYKGWNPLMIRAKWSQYLTDLFRAHHKDFKTLWIVASSANAAPSEFYENGATIVCVQKSECESLLREYFLKGN